MLAPKTVTPQQAAKATKCPSCHEEAKQQPGLKLNVTDHSFRAYNMKTLPYKYSRYAQFLSDVPQENDNGALLILNSVK